MTTSNTSTKKQRLQPITIDELKEYGLIVGNSHSHGNDTGYVDIESSPNPASLDSITRIMNSFNNHKHDAAPYVTGDKKDNIESYRVGSNKDRALLYAEYKHIHELNDTFQSLSKALNRIYNKVVVLSLTLEIVNCSHTRDVSSPSHKCITEVTQSLNHSINECLNGAEYANYTSKKLISGRAACMLYDATNMANQQFYVNKSLTEEQRAHFEQAVLHKERSLVNGVAAIIKERFDVISAKRKQLIALNKEYKKPTPDADGNLPEPTFV